MIVIAAHVSGASFFVVFLLYERGTKNKKMGGHHARLQTAD